MSKPTLEQRTAFVELLKTPCSSVLREPAQQCSLPRRVRQLITAHAAYESGWGTARAAQGFNFWNLTAGKLWRGKTLDGPDMEFSVETLKPKAIVQKFRQYGDVLEAVTDYLAFLKLPRYADGLKKLLLGDSSFVEDLGVYKLGPGKSIMPAWLTGLGKGGFYTLPI